MHKLVILLAVFCHGSGGENRKFPPNFMYGAGSSAVQVEGAWNEDGKGESGWNYVEHNIPGIILDNSTSDVACDSYYRYKEDLPFLKMAGMNTYRFSLSWSRLLPNGYTDNINQKGVDYYNNLINEVIRNNLTPVVTMNHFDMPLSLVQLGGWTNISIVETFAAYAEFVLHTFGDRVKNWVPINEANWECILTYRFGAVAPLRNASDSAAYTCGHVKLLAHAEVYRRFKRMPSAIQDGAVMGWSITDPTYYPWNSSNPLDIAAADVAFEFNFDWLVHPIFGAGGYPPLMREVVDRNSFREGRLISRLPRFKPAELVAVKGSADFLSFNQYTGLFASFENHCPGYVYSQCFPDSRVFTCQKNGYFKSYANFSEVVPGNVRDKLTTIRVKYNNPPVFITENGFPDGPGENLTYNQARQSFFQQAITEVMQSISDGSNLFGYLVWSLLDDFEWSSGYTLKFGLVHVDFENVNRTRTAKPIVSFFRDIAEYGINITDTRYKY